MTTNYLIRFSDTELTISDREKSRFVEIVVDYEPKWDFMTAVEMFHVKLLEALKSLEGDDESEVRIVFYEPKGKELIKFIADDKYNTVNDAIWSFMDREGVTYQDVRLALLMPVLVDLGINIMVAEKTYFSLDLLRTANEKTN